MVTFDLGIKCISNPLRYFIPLLAYVKSAVKARITLVPFFVKDPRYRLSHDIFDTHTQFDIRQSSDQSCVHT